MDAAASFYSGLFGWTSEDAGGETDDTRGYTFFMLDGQRVVGYGPPGPGEPPSWRVHVAVESADDTTAKVRDAGGRVLLEPMDITDAGRIAVFTDPAGAVFCIWQPNAHEGAQVSREPNSLGWFEHVTRDGEGAKRFYGAVFGWDTVEIDAGYAIWKLGETELGGLTAMDNMPAEAPPNWMSHFLVEDVDATARRASDLGGTVTVPPTTVQIPDRGDLRFAVLADPNGAAFGVFAA